MPLFFGLKRPIEASVDIVALTGTTGYLTYVWSKVDSVSAWGMVPYLGWLAFATYLSVSILICSVTEDYGHRHGMYLFVIRSAAGT